MGKPWQLLLNYKPCHPDLKSSSTPNTKSTKTDTHISSSSSSSSSSFSSSSCGCICTIFHLFHQPSFISKTFINNQETNIILKGMEAPRNSLELEKHKHVDEKVASFSSKLNQERNFNNYPMGEIQIKTKASRLLLDDVSPESCNTKTPNLVARLMGLDLLPEHSSPRPSSSSYRNNARSLPATPRVSTAARSSTEIDHHHRLSLQIIDESTSKQIAKQVRENSSRRFGFDVTNTVKKREQRRDELLVMIKQKRPSPPVTTTAIGKSRNLDQRYGRGKENGPISLPCSPKLKFLNNDNNLRKPNSNAPLSSTSEVIKAPKSQSMKDEVQKVKPMKVQKCKRIASEKYDLRSKKMHRKEEEAFVKKCNKKDMAAPSSTILPQKQVPLTTVTPSSHRMYGPEPTQKLCGKICGFPATDYWVIRPIAFEGAVEELVTDIECDVFDTLVNEMIGIIWHGGCVMRV